LGVLAVSFFAWLAVYESGYMENDVFTVDRETNPTLRISRDEMDWVKANFFKILAVRLVLFLLSTYFLWYFFADYFSLVYYFSIIGLTRLVFYFHNQGRSRWNILTYFLLSVGKYLFL